MESISKLLKSYNKWLRSMQTVDIPFHVIFLRTVLQVISAIIRDLKNGQLSLRAMSLVYTTIISIVPLIAISFSVLKGLGAHNQIKPFLLNTLDPLGEKKIEVTDKIIGFVDNIQVGVLGAVGIAVLLYTVIGLMQKIENAFNFVWGVERSRNLTKRFNDYLSILFVGPVLIFLSTAMTTSLTSGYLVERINEVERLQFVIPLFGIIVPYFILSVAFTFMYSFIPNTKVNVKAAFIGGLMTAFLWKLMGWGFTNFVAGSSSHTLIYSAFATVIVFMVWIYLVWLVLLIGSSISFYIQNPQYRLNKNKFLSLSPSNKETAALEIMTHIAQSYFADKPVSSVNELAKICKFPLQAVDEIIYYLSRSELISVEEGTGSIVPKRPLEHITYFDIINSVRIRTKSDEDTKLSNNDTENFKNEIDEVLQKSFGKRTLKNMIQK
ncbi:MAG: ribonuclease BN [Alphaproteobacteria bacterium CG11_big_fil_rev_8_21_14_0_20_39_49]|nr:MAG: ribonuclease BN [Alphaproteobacteria bacterium CG11_big_fil_rev_8_21_14_0_20_39_49]